MAKCQTRWFLLTKTAHDIRGKITKLSPRADLKALVVKKRHPGIMYKIGGLKGGTNVLSGSLHCFFHSEVTSMSYAEAATPRSQTRPVSVPPGSVHQPFHTEGGTEFDRPFPNPWSV